MYQCILAFQSLVVLVFSRVLQENQAKFSKKKYGRRLHGFKNTKDKLKTLGSAITAVFGLMPKEGEVK